MPAYKVHSLGQQPHHERRRAWIGAQRRTQHMRRHMAKALIPAVRAVRAQRGRQRFAVDADAIVAASGPRQFDARLLAHHVHHVQWTADLLRKHSRVAVGRIVGGVVYIHMVRDGGIQKGVRVRLKQEGENRKRVKS